MNTGTMKDFFTIWELARERRVTRGRIYHMIRDGLIKATRIGQRVWVVDRTEVQRLVNERKAKGLLP